MFLSFGSEQQRTEFLDYVRRERPDLLAKLQNARHQPTIVGRGLSEEEMNWLERSMRGRGKTHPDVKFSPMLP